LTVDVVGECKVLSLLQIKFTWTLHMESSRILWERAKSSRESFSYNRAAAVISKKF
jgi:hypothetical protein